VNAPFTLDVGRVQVDWAADATRAASAALARHAGEALVALFDETAAENWVKVAVGLGLEPAMSPQRMWESFWALTDFPKSTPEPLAHVFRRAAVALFERRDALPTGFTFEPHHSMTTIPRVCHVLGGPLDDAENSDLLGEAMTWDEFRRFRPGTIVSGRVWDRLEPWLESGTEPPERVELAGILLASLQANARVDPTRAERYGSVAARGLLDEDEQRAIREAARFRTRSGSWAPPRDLLNRKALWAIGANDAVDAVERALQDVFVQEEQGAEGLVLRGRRDVAIDREIGEEFVDFRFGHLLRMAFVVEEDETPGPVVIGVFGANGVVANAAGLAEPVAAPVACRAHSTGYDGERCIPAWSSPRSESWPARNCPATRPVPAVAARSTRSAAWGKVSTTKRTSRGTFSSPCR